MRQKRYHSHHSQNLQGRCPFKLQGTQKIEMGSEDE